MGAVAGAAAGIGLRAGAGYLASQAMASKMEEADKEASKELDETEDDGCAGKCDEEEERRKKAEGTHDNIEDYEGKDYDEVERDLDEKLRDGGGWKKQPLKKGDGARYTSPDGKRQVRINRGYPRGNYQGNADGLHNGPYISRPSTGTRMPLKSNLYLGS